MALPEHRIGTVPSGDVTLSYRAFGAPGATPILFAHGANYFDSYDWIEVADQLSGAREVVAFDWRGFGDSTWSPSANYSMDAMSGDISTMIDHLGWDKPVLVGHSMAGRNSIIYAANSGEKISKLIVVDHAPGSTPTKSKDPYEKKPPLIFQTVEEAQAHFDTGEQRSRFVHDRVRAEASLKKVDGGLMIKRDPNFNNTEPQGDGIPAPKLNGVDMWEQLSKVTVPAMIIRGKRSDRFKPEALERVKRDFKHIRLVEVDGTHDVATTAPGELIAAIQDFVAS